MKTAIVSCYFQHNYGSMLQAYATQMALDKLKIDNETIDISGFQHEIRNAKCKYFLKASLTSDFLFLKFGMVKNVLWKKMMHNTYGQQSRIRDQEFESFYRKFIRLSEPYPSKTALHRVCRERYSTVLVGSDQLWLPGNIAADYYTLNFVPEDVNTVAYATSFGQAFLPRDITEKARAFLTKINNIGIREVTGQDIIEQLTGRKVPMVCDPTLLFTGEEWLAIQELKPKVTEPYIFCYFLGRNRQHREFAKRLREKTGYRIVALVHLDEYVKCDEEYADETPYQIDPADFLNLIRNAAYVCTDSFHCTVFSILYQRNFFAFHRYRTTTKQSTNHRLDSLLHLIGIENGIKCGDESIEKCLGEKIDYHSVLSKVENIREKSYQFLKEAIIRPF